jgi:hypothetical protein
MEYENEQRPYDGVFVCLCLVCYILTVSQTSLAATNAIAADLRVLTVAMTERVLAAPLQVVAIAGKFLLLLLSPLDGTVR